ncbi:hypothetical protein M2163_008790 [Streptomyces sp. SAI-135]|nr:hypothetical protein [Streptomyces sp. SAI-135]
MGGSVGGFVGSLPAGAWPHRGGAGQLRRDLGPVGVRGLRGAEGVVVALVQRCPCRLVEAQLHVAGVRARRERAGPRGEADLQVTVRRGGGVGERAEGARDVGAALDGPGTGEAVGRVRRVRLEVVAELDALQGDAVGAGVPDLEPGFRLIRSGPGGAGPVLDAQAVGGRVRGGRECGERGGTHTYGEGGGRGGTQPVRGGSHRCSLQKVGVILGMGQVCVRGGALRRVRVGPSSVKSPDGKAASVGRGMRSGHLTS